VGRSALGLTTIVLFYKPSEFPDSWVNSDLAAKGRTITGVSTLTDRNGLEAQRFGAATSGQALLYDPNGRIVVPRRHNSRARQVGENAGSRAISYLSEWRRAGPRVSPSMDALWSPQEKVRIDDRHNDGIRDALATDETVAHKRALVYRTSANIFKRTDRIFAGLMFFNGSPALGRRC